MIRMTLLVLILSQVLFAADPINDGPTQITDSIPTSENDSNKFVQESGFTLKALSVDLHTAMALFAQSAGLTLRSEVPLEGVRNIDFKNKNLTDAIKTILQVDTIPWVIENNTLIIGQRPAPTIKKKFKGIEIEGDNTYRIITIDYPQTSRTSRNAAEGAVNGLNGRAAEVSITSQDQNDFWQEVNTAISDLKSETGKSSINYLTGVVYLQDSVKQLNTIQKYLTTIVPILTRQVKITARIYEVDLSDEKTLGIDWGFISQRNFDILDAGSSTQTATITRDGFKSPTFAANLGFVDNFNVIIEGLSQQGELRSVSQPRITTVHNQPAIVKVGTLYPYFNTLVQLDPNSGQRLVTETVQQISLGTWLSITPQISKDSSITLTIDPVLTTLAGNVVSTQGNQAPIVDIKQSSSVLRVKDRETVRISGLQQTRNQSIARKVPFLGEIPVLGKLFQWENTKKSRTELVIFITTEVVE